MKHQRNCFVAMQSQLWLHSSDTALLYDQEYVPFIANRLDNIYIKHEANGGPEG